ncbi:MAG: ATP-binding protein [Candidatus Aminicenantes bacterium]|nr:ATP-binding protein [Candidatus Aminicenantes bacterium]
MNVKDRKSLEVVVHKRHIVAIGERLYAESVELLRELVNNAYDADAEEVHVTVAPDRIEVRDDGTGMDEAGLQEYFVIGSEDKVIHARSPRFHRERIGQFGIGKFASLSAASRFEVVTRRGRFAARVVFDKEDWERTRGVWRLPCEILEPSAERGDGTTVVLSGLTKSFDVEQAADKIRESVPLKASHFAVFLNGRRLAPRSYTGQKIAFLDGCRFGPVSGEVVIVPRTQADPLDLGIEVKVKGATIKKDLFGMETWGPAVARVKGEVHANFLPITSDRGGFVTDSPEYQEFLALMEKVVAVIRRKLGKEADRREDLRAGRAVKEALQRVLEALKLNPDFSPFGPIPAGDGERGIGGGAAVAKGAAGADPAEDGGGAKPKTKRKRNPAIKKITPNAIVKRIRFGDKVVSVCLDHFGESGPECFSEGNAVYVNRDHPLFVRESRKPGPYTMYIARLLTQEISLMKENRNPRAAFNRQSKLLRDAFSRD